MITQLTSADWHRLQEIFESVSGLPSEQRQRFLDTACADRPLLRARAEALLLSESDATWSGAIHDEAMRGTALPEPGMRAGSYRILELIGSGGMGVVYRADRDDDQYHKQVAIKIATAGQFSPELRERFLIERQILANLEHPNIARMLDGGTTADGLPYVVIEFVAGKPIDVYCREKRLDAKEKVELIIQVARAVDYAHRHLVVHRDLKPDNILITEDGTPKLLDFGIAKALNPAAVGISDGLTVNIGRLMTPEYASPEQIQGEAITTATDVYQIGVLLYLLLVGERPFRKLPGSRMGDLERMICELPPPRPNVDRDLDLIVLQALEKDPACRYPSAGELADDLECYRNGFPIKARRALWSYRTMKFAQRNKVPVGAVIGLLVLLISFTVALAVQARHARRQRDRAEQERNAALQISKFLSMIFAAPDPAKDRGRNVSARDLLDRGAEGISKQAIADPMVRDQLLVTLAESYENLGVFDRAADLFQKSYDLRRKIFGENSQETVEGLGRLADIQIEEGNFHRVMEILPRWLELSRKVTGPESQETSQALRLEATGAMIFGDTATAEADERQVLEIQRTLHGDMSSEAAAAWSFLGYIQGYRGEDEASVESYRRVLAILKRGDWENSENVIAILHAECRMAYVLAEQGHYREAETILVPALQMRRRMQGEKHTEVGNTEIDLGFLYASEGRFAEAERLLQDALAIHVAAAKDSIWIAGDQEELARLAVYRKRYPEAISRLNQVLHIYRARSGSHQTGHKGESGYMAHALMLLGRAQLGLGEKAEAESTLESALAMSRQYNGDASAYTAQDYWALSQAQLALGKLSLAEKNLHAALSIYRTSQPSILLGRAQALESMGSLLLREGRYTESKILLMEAAAIRRNMMSGVPVQR